MNTLSVVNTTSFEADNGGQNAIVYAVTGQYIERPTDRKAKNWDNRSKINLYSYWLKLSIICELQYNYHITAIAARGT